MLSGLRAVVSSEGEHGENLIREDEAGFTVAAETALSGTCAGSCPTLRWAPCAEAALFFHDQEAGRHA